MTDRKRILVTGSRDWTDENAIVRALDEAIGGAPVEVTIVHGDCPTGADHMAAAYVDGAEAPELTRQRVTIEAYPADWKTHGRAAGPLRNAQMVALGADLCLAFIGPCTSPRCNIEGDHASHGATGCAQLAEDAGIPVKRYPGGRP